ncbi:extracellular matrix protein 1-like [Phyllopteryx taeniolatus]|uniref:extracellular matrix protein 1-like n=1 Tax=Phyllopteryx taeniolatus TaxID=161469 RepID=UPI002AD34B4C|nr:extracellular matrix protein 1-like [Phyllopteryx taeniolatus]
MGSSWLVFHAAVGSLLVLLGSANHDKHNMEQREITFDFGDVMHLMQSPESQVMQQEADLSDLVDTKEFAMQEKLDTPRGRGSRPASFSPRGRRPSAGSRSEIPMLDYPVQFPLGQPTSDNLQAVCLHGDLRPRYPDSYFPNSGFGQLRRRASAVNNAESWFSACCAGNQTWGKEATLCCAMQAWELSVENFCKEDSSVKDRLYHCCRKTGSQRLNCFQKDSPNPRYEPSEAIPVVPLPATVEFSFDKNTCYRTSVTQLNVSESRQQSGSQKSEINFPPGRPSADNVESLCRNQKQRPLYSVKCLPSSGYELLAHQAKIINRMEKGFKQCCKKNQDVLVCAEQKWRDALRRFCSSKKGGKVDYECCLGSTASDGLGCFQAKSPDPHYNMTSQEELSPKICQSRKIIKKVLPDGFHAKNILNECCAMTPQDHTTCFVQKVEETSVRMCTSKKTSPPVARRCCRMAPLEQPKCVTNFVMDAITKATKVSNQKKKKRCPL